MTITELIEELENHRKAYGDQDVVLYVRGERYPVLEVYTWAEYEDDARISGGDETIEDLQNMQEFYERCGKED